MRAREQSRAARAGQSRAEQRAADGELLGSERREAGTGGSSAAPISGGGLSIVARTRVTLDEIPR